MGITDITQAVGLTGSVVLFELVMDDGEGGKDHSWLMCFVAGVVLGLEGVYPHPHFVVYYLESKIQRWPEQLFFSDIRSYNAVPDHMHKSIKPVASISLLGA